MTSLPTITTRWSSTEVPSGVEFLEVRLPWPARYVLAVWNRTSGWIYPFNPALAEEA